MCDEKLHFKHLDILSFTVLFICGVLLIVVSACKHAGMIHLTSASDSSIDGSVGWDLSEFTDDVANPTGVLSACVDSGMVIGSFSIIGCILIIFSSITFVYVRVFRHVIFRAVYQPWQQQVFMACCLILCLFLVVPSVVYYTQCTQLIESAQGMTVDGLWLDISRFSPDYGILLLWISCFGLAVLFVLNCAMYRWRHPEHHKHVATHNVEKDLQRKEYGNVPTTELIHVVEEKPEDGAPVTHHQVSLQEVTSTEQMHLKQEDDENVDLVPRNQ